MKAKGKRDEKNTKTTVNTENPLSPPVLLFQLPLATCQKEPAGLASPYLLHTKGGA